MANLSNRVGAFSTALSQVLKHYGLALVTIPFSNPSQASQTSLVPFLSLYSDHTSQEQPQHIFKVYPIQDNARLNQLTQSLRMLNDLPQTPDCSLDELHTCTGHVTGISHIWNYIHLLFWNCLLESHLISPPCFSSPTVLNGAFQLEWLHPKPQYHVHTYWNSKTSLPFP